MERLSANDYNCGYRSQEPQSTSSGTKSLWYGDLLMVSAVHRLVDVYDERPDETSKEPLPEAR